jgi:hypothetical protein
MAGETTQGKLPDEPLEMETRGRKPMTYEDYQRDILKDPAYLPPPPMPRPMPTFGQRMGNMRNSVARRIANAVTSTPFGYPSPSALGGTMHRFLRSVVEGSPATHPSFAPMPGERMALQMPGLKPVRDWFMGGYENDPVGFRDMPRSSSAPFVPERNTQFIPGPQRPEATPYPAPPFLNFSNWLKTGERGPLPLDNYLPGGYPDPITRQMPEAYEARTSGGMLG